MVTFKFFVQKFFVDLAKKSKVADVKAADKNSSKSADDQIRRYFRRSGRCTDFPK